MQEANKSHTENYNVIEKDFKKDDSVTAKKDNNSNLIDKID